MPAKASINNIESDGTGNIQRLEKYLRMALGSQAAQKWRKK